MPHPVRLPRHATLRLSLSATGRLWVAVTRLSRPNRGAVAMRRYTVQHRKLSLRLPKRFRGHAFRPGRYRVAVVIVDAQGSRSRPVRRSFAVRHARG